MEPEDYARPTEPADHPFIYVYCGRCGHRHKIPGRCPDRFCVICSRPRAADIRHNLEYIVNNLPLADRETLKMITLSVRNCQDLALGIRHLVKSFRKLRQTKLWKRHVSGGATIIEITGKKGNYHPHLHVLCYSSWIPWDKLLHQWRLCSGGIGVYILDVPLRKALYYVTKYVSKCEAPEDSWQFIGQELKKYRLFQKFGTWHRVVIPKRKSNWTCVNCGYEFCLSEFAINRSFYAFDTS